MKKRPYLLPALLLAMTVTTYTETFATPRKKAPVAGFARSFILGTPLANATVTILETGKTIKTDGQGHFGPILYPVGQPITFEIQKWGYKTTQTGTTMVSRKGLTGPHRNVTFQVPTLATYYLFAAAIGQKLNKDSCHVTTTITAYHKTLYDAPQGEVDAKVVLKPTVKVTPFYFDVFKSGPFKDKTNPMTKGLRQTTEDGGVGFANLPPSDKAYVITAMKKGVRFTKAQFICRKGAFINISPPQGPTIVKK